MAQQGYPMDSVKFSCSICLDLLKTPVTIPCGHNYCMYCIGSFWDDEDKKGIHSCPQCRQQFTPRPVLVKNTMLAELVEDVRKTGPQPAPDDDSLVGPEDVACDICTVRKMKAIKSCLVCLVSYCENHLQPHYDIPGLKKHKLVNPSKTLQDNICSHHDEVMKIFCHTDQQCICYLCTMDEHKGHETVPAAAERAEKQKELQVSRQQIHQRIQDQEKDVKLLQQEVEAINVSADKAVEDSEKIFTELIRLLQERSSEVKQQIRSQQETEVSRVKDVQEKLEQEITELKRKDAELEQLSHTEDHTQFLLNYPSLPALRESTHSSSINIRPLRHFEDVTAAVTELKTKVLDILRDPPKTSSASKADVLPQPMAVLPQPMAVLPQPMAVSSQPSEPKTREDFLKYSRKLTLSRNTAHKFLELSEGNRKVTMTNENQYYEDHEDRFTRRWQVLSKQRLTGRCYWEVEWTQGRSIEVAVAYDNIERTGDTKESTFGLNENSWALCCQPNSYKYYGVDVDDDDDNDGYNDCYNDDYNDGYNGGYNDRYNDGYNGGYDGYDDGYNGGYNDRYDGYNGCYDGYDDGYNGCYNDRYNDHYDDAVVIPVTNPYSSRVGVYLDHRAGILSFYSVYGSQMTLIHKAETTFTQPLHAGIWLSRSKGTSAEFIQLK